MTDEQIYIALNAIKKNIHFSIVIALQLQALGLVKRDPDSLNVRFFLTEEGKQKHLELKPKRGIK